MNRDNRYQNQPWYVRLWRRRHYLRVPFDFLRYQLRSNQAKDAFFGDCAPGERRRFNWGLAIGCAQVRMNWVYDWEEIRRDLPRVH